MMNYRTHCAWCTERLWPADGWIEVHAPTLGRQVRIHHHCRNEAGDRRLADALGVVTTAATGDTARAGEEMMKTYQIRQSVTNGLVFLEVVYDNMPPIECRTFDTVAQALASDDDLDWTEVTDAMRAEDEVSGDILYVADDPSTA